MKLGKSILSVACISLLSTGAMAMSPDERARSQGSTHLDNQPTTELSSERSQDQMGSGSQSTESITGEILRVQGELFVVKDEAGKEVKLHVDQSTQKSGDLKKGDKIEAEISPKGHAVSIKKSTDEGSDQGSNRP